jgi:hypothetical protein
MRILYATTYRHGNVTDLLYRAMKRMGLDVVFITPVKAPYEDAIQVKPDLNLPDFVKNLSPKPDIYLFADVLDRIPFLPRGVLELDCTTVHYAMDNHLNLRWQKEYCGLFDYAFFTQFDRMEQTKKMYGYTHLHWLPYCCDETYHRDFGLDRTINVGFVAGITPDRQKFLESLARKGVPVTINDRFLAFEEVGEFYSRCKIVLNVSARYDLNMRAFEACCAGALTVGQKYLDSSFAKIFTPGENTLVHDFDDAADVIKEALATPAKTREMAENGKKIVLSGHTYIHRMKRLMEICAGGVSNDRILERGSWLGDMKLGLTFQHPQFRLSSESMQALGKAFSKNPAGATAYAMKYAGLRIIEKAEKFRLSLGKAPI